MVERIGPCLLTAGVGALLTSCGVFGGAKVRYDAAPSPVNNNFHTVLMETTCGGRSQLGYGQSACSLAAGEPYNGELILHTPLPGAIRLIGRLCGVDSAKYHNDVEGSFRIPIAELLDKVPESVTSCVVEVFVNWDLVKGMTSDYPLDGMIGRFYYRRRLEGRTTASMTWGPSPALVGTMQGVGFGQFRSVARGGFPVSEPLELVIKTSKPVLEGTYRLFGCGAGVELGTFSGDTIRLSREALIGPLPGVGGCMMFGYAMGKTAQGEAIHDDLVLGVEVFGKNVMRLAGSVALKDGKVCYTAESSVSVTILNHGTTNQLSTKLEDCFKMPADGKARLGFFTHKGRSVYAVIEGGVVEYVQ